MIWTMIALVFAVGAVVVFVRSKAAKAGSEAAMRGVPMLPATRKTSPDIAEFVAWQDAHLLPAIKLEAKGPAPQTAGGSRIGGPVWLPKGEGWPTGKNGKPLSFLAQIDFSVLPPLEDYPRSGVLQFFIGRDDLYGADFNRPEAGNFKVIFRESVNGPGTLRSSKLLGTGGIDDYSPVYAKAMAEGVALVGRSETHVPSTAFWKIERDLPRMTDDGFSDAVYAHIDADMQARPERYGMSHHIGGHIELTQTDFRSATQYADYDRVLLQLWSDDGTIMWGDLGQGNFMIRREDLIKRDFSRVTYHWDCY